MLLNSFNFIALFPFIFTLYWLIPSCRGGYRRGFLLLLSYGLYTCWNPAWALLLLAVSALTYIGALLMESSTSDVKRNRRLVAVITPLVFLPLIFWKYYNFISCNLEDGLRALGVTVGLPGLNWAVPIGISFFTFQAAGYMFDVYFGKIKAERSFLDYALFVAFFPQIAAGPISRAGSLLPQLKSLPAFDYAKAVQVISCK